MCYERHRSRGGGSGLATARNARSAAPVHRMVRRIRAPHGTARRSLTAGSIFGNRVEIAPKPIGDLTPDPMDFLNGRFSSFLDHRREALQVCK